MINISRRIILRKNDIVNQDHFLELLGSSRLRHELKAIGEGIISHKHFLIWNSGIIIANSQNGCENSKEKTQKKAPGKLWMMKPHLKLFLLLLLSGDEYQLL